MGIHTLKCTTNPPYDTQWGAVFQDSVSGLVFGPVWDSADQADEFLYRLSIGKVYLGWTTDYYESQGWPGSSQQQIEDLSLQYDAAVTRVHSFDISKMDESSAEILEKLTAMFERGWEEKINQEEK